MMGSCLCGAVQYEADEIQFIQLCHCRTCQVAQGAPYIAGGAVKRENARKEADTKRAAAEQERVARQQSAAQQVEQYNLAFRNCLAGRGYSVSLSQPGTPAAPAQR